MKRFNWRIYGIGLVVAAAAWLASAERAAAVFTLTGTAAELVARGINADFELPAQTRAAGENFSTNNAGGGWSFNLISGVANNYGVQDPADTFYSAPPLPAPFEQFQVGFYNLNNPFSQAELVSSPIGRLQAGQTYTLDVAVGMRLTAAMNQTAYRVGLRSSNGTDLGTFAIGTVVPSGTAGTITNLQYTLDASTVPSFVGDNVRVVIGGYNTSLSAAGAYTNQNAQANFDNVRLAGTFDDLTTVVQSALLDINRSTGVITLSNTGAANLTVTGYSLTSTNGSFNQSEWTKFGSPFTQASENGIATDLSEVDLSGSGTVLTTSTPRDLGDAWYRTPYQDVQGQLLLSDGSRLALTIQYSGTGIASGDLNSDGPINGADWTLFKAGATTSFTGLSRAQSYFKGDLNGDLKHDLADFQLFRTAYNAGSGAGAFEAMLAGIPEPSTVLLLISGGFFMLTNMRRQNGSFKTSHASRQVFSLLVVLGICVLAAAPASAQTTIAHWTFDAASRTDSGGNITGFADTTGNHNASAGAGIGSGTGSPWTSNPIPIANNITGRFGQGLTLTGFNTAALGGGQFLMYPNLNELTTLLSAPGAPSYTISYWINTTMTVSQNQTILSDWGNSAGQPGRFTYAFGTNFATGTPQMRTQTRFNTGATGNGTDIFARAANATTPTPFNNGSWHMFTWTFDTSIGQLRSYYDAALVDTFNSTQTNFNMVRSSSSVGTWGFKGDTAGGGFLNGTLSLDEGYVFNGVLTQDQIDNLFNNNSLVPITITLRVDPATGQAQLRNNSGEDISINAYRVTSAAGSLKPSTWTPISSQSISGFPAGDGSGNGWEAPPGGSHPADYNQNGVVDSGDYVLWRKSNINGAAGYNAWRAAFGATGSGPGGTVNELVEWYLQGNSLFANAATPINLGQAFNIGGTQDLAFQISTDSGVRIGLVEYGSLGSGSGAEFATVPEPSSAGLIMLVGGVLSVCRSRRRRYAFSSAMARAFTLVGMLAALWTSSAMATVTNDRLYRFGENGGPPQTQENAVAGQPVGSGAGNPAPGNTLDHVGPTGSFQVMLASSCPVGTCPSSNGNLPVYQDLTGLGRTGFGIVFDGTDDYLNGFALGLPPISRATARHILVYGSGSGTLDYDGVYQRGFQTWVYPHSGATADQHVVSDTTEFGVRITAAGNWQLRHAGTNVGTTVPATPNQWAHVMVAMPEISQPHKGVLYVNGVAVAAQSENYDTSMAVTAQALIVGANTDISGTLVGTTNHFRGVVDEMEMFIWGRGYNSTTGVFTDFGTFNLRTDNAWAAANLSSTFGDIAGSSGIDQADVNAFVGGWLDTKTVNGQRVGDVTTYAKGDLNFDGITDLTDAAIFRPLLGLGSGAGAGLDLSAFNALVDGAVPEPGAFGLACLALAGGAMLRPRKTSRAS